MKKLAVRPQHSVIFILIAGLRSVRDLVNRSNGRVAERIGMRSAEERVVVGRDEAGSAGVQRSALRQGRA